MLTRSRLIGSLARGQSRATLSELLKTAQAAPWDPAKAVALGSAYLERGEYTKSLYWLRRPISAGNTTVSLYRALAETLLQLDRPEAALECYERAMALGSAGADDYRALGNILRDRLGRPDDAVQHFLAAVRLEPDEQTHYFSLFRCLIRDRISRHAKRMALELLGAAANRQCLDRGLALALEDCGRYSEADECCQEILRGSPDDPTALMLLGEIRVALDDIDSATCCYEKAVRSNPADRRVHTHYLYHLCRLGEYERAQRTFRQRKFGTEFSEDLPKAVRPETDLRGRSLLLLELSGLGDTLQFVRFATDFAKSGCRVFVRCAKKLVPLVQTVKGVEKAFARYDPAPDTEFESDLFFVYLPLDITLENAGRRVPYLDVPDSCKRRWASRLAAEDGLKVGIAWRGSLLWQDNPYTCRSMPLAELRPLADLPGITLYGLQVGKAAGELTEGVEPFPAVDLSREITDFASTAGAITALDVVVTIDTSLAHLVGGLGKPVLLMLPYVAELRWLLGRRDSPWYPTMTLFRQSSPGDWRGVIQRVAGALADLSRRGGPPHARCSSNT